jgi:hypothetical protein
MLVGVVLLVAVLPAPGLADPEPLTPLDVVELSRSATVAWRLNLSNAGSFVVSLEGFGTDSIALAIWVYAASPFLVDGAGGGSSEVLHLDMGSGALDVNLESANDATLPLYCAILAGICQPDSIVYHSPQFPPGEYVVVALGGGHTEMEGFLNLSGSAGVQDVARTQGPGEFRREREFSGTNIIVQAPGPGPEFKFIDANSRFNSSHHTFASYWGSSNTGMLQLGYSSPSETFQGSDYYHVDGGAPGDYVFSLKDIDIGGVPLLAPEHAWIVLLVGDVELP